MKRLIIAALVATTALTSCKKDDPIRDNASPIYIWGKSVPNKAEAMSVHEILTSVDDSVLIGVNANVISDGRIGALFSKACLKNDVDTVQNRLIMEARNIIEDGKLGYAFLNGRNYYITLECQTRYTSRVDTVGYIPNSIWHELTYEIDNLWHTGNIEEIYRLFNEAFYFYPCTPEEYKAQIEEIDWEEVGVNDLTDRPRWLPKYEKK